MKNKLRKVLVIPDLHIRYKAKKSDKGHDELSLKAVEKYMADEKWDEILYLGDVMDFHQLARFNKDVPESLCRTLSDDYRVTNAILDRHQRIVKKNAPQASWTYIMGNHSDRVRVFTDKIPQLKGIIDVDKNLKLNERGFKVVKSYPNGELHKIGNAYFHHGLYTSQNHPKKTAEAYGVNIFYGHTHDVQSYSKVLWGKDKTIVGQSLGCLCEYDLDYVGTNPTRWQQAITTFYFRKGGHFNHYVSRIFNHQFTAPNGKTYKP